MSGRYIIRFDDICPTMDWEAWSVIESLLIRYQIVPLLAVVPDNKDPGLCVNSPKPDFWEQVRKWQARGWGIALHGHNHCYVTKDAGLVGLNNYSEFAGLSIDEQRRKLAAAVGIFSEQRVIPDAWVAPAHSFDLNTVRALVELGIGCISDGFTFGVRDRYGVRWVPQQLWRFRDMPFGIWTVCLHSNGMSEQALSRLASDLDRFQLRILSFKEVADSKDLISRWSILDSAFSRAWHLAFRTRQVGS